LPIAGNILQLPGLGYPRASAWTPWAQIGLPEHGRTGMPADGESSLVYRLADVPDPQRSQILEELGDAWHATDGGDTLIVWMLGIEFGSGVGQRAPEVGYVVRSRKAPVWAPAL